MTMTTKVMVALVSLVGLVSGASEEKMVPMSIAVSEGGLPGMGYQQPYVQQQQQTYSQVPYNQAVSPPNYGNQPGPSENAIAPNVNPYPRQSYCIVTGYPCNVSSECCTAGCDVFGPVSQCCIPEGQVCDFSRPTHANQYSCCYPLSCDPYKATGLTVCQERLGRYPDSGRNRGLGEAAVAGVQKLVSVPWYSDQNPLWKHDSGKDGYFEEEGIISGAEDVDVMTTTT